MSSVNTMTHKRGAATRLWLAVAVVSALILALLTVPIQPAGAQQAPTGVNVEQGYGFATVSWDQVGGAEEYHIERTLLDGDAPAGPAEVVGVWTPDPDFAGGEPDRTEFTFADSGFVLGERYRWRVRAVVDGSEGDWSQPVADDTQGLLGPEEFHTGFELAGGLEWTLHEDEVEVVEAIAAASDRVRLETIGESYEGRPLHLATVGYPEPMEKEEIAESPSVFITCTIHGAERSGREACLILLRDLAFSDDPRVIDILSNATVLINPTANPDGQAVARRTNTAGQDMNRDHLVLRHPEAVALSEVQRDHRPEILVDAHELGSGPDLEWLSARSLTVPEELFTLGMHDYVRGRLFGAAEATGWSRLQYRATPGNNWEAWNANVPGLKNHIGLLQETARAIPPSRPGEGPVGAFDHPGSQQRRVYSQLWALHETLDYHRENLPVIQNVIAAAEAAHSANVGPIYLDGRYDLEINPPTNQAPTVVLDPYCGYRLSPEQYSVQDSGTLIGPLAGQEWTSGTVEERLAAHGVDVEELGAGIVQVPLAQRLRAVLPYVLDPELITATRTSLPNLSMVEATRLDDRRPTVVVGDVDSGVPNRVDDVSCSINDLIADEQAWPTHGRFMRHVTSVVAALRAAGLVSDGEGGAIINAAAHSDVGQ